MIALALAAAPQTQVSMDVQVDRAHRAADAALNAQYRTTMAIAAKKDIDRASELKAGAARPDGQPSYQAALLASERAWLAYRDAQCVVAGFPYRGGTMEDLAGGQCLVTLTRARTAELTHIALGLSN